MKKIDITNVVKLLDKSRLLNFLLINLKNKVCKCKLSASNGFFFLNTENKTSKDGYTKIITAFQDNKSLFLPKKVITNKLTKKP